MPTKELEAPKAYSELYSKYKAADAESKGGNAKARAEKQKYMQDIRAMERQSAREGILLDGGQAVAKSDSKRSLQEEYVRRFDDKAEVTITNQHGEYKGTLRDYHSKRLLKK